MLLPRLSLPWLSNHFLDAAVTSQLSLEFPELHPNSVQSPNCNQKSPPKTGHGMTGSIPKTKTRKHPTVSGQCWVGQSEAWNTFKTWLLLLPSSVSMLTLLLSPNKEEITSYLLTVFLDMFILQTHFTKNWLLTSLAKSNLSVSVFTPSILLHKSYLKILCVCMIISPIYFSYHCTPRAWYSP